jgi:arginyl-tRNA synthetase
MLDRTFEYKKFEPNAGYLVWETTHGGQGDASAPKFGGAQRVVNVIDSRQAYLQKVVKEGVRQVGHIAGAENSIHFSYEMVALTPATAKALGMEISEEDAARAYVEMSGRKGLGVKADDLLDVLEQRAADAVKANSEISNEDAAALGKQIAIAALRYFMLRFGRNKVIAFDFNEALKFEGDSGPYLQYSTVRVQNIFRKMAERGVDPRIDERSVDDLTLNQGLTDEMWELVRGSAELPGPRAPQPEPAGAGATRCEGIDRPFRQGWRQVGRGARPKHVGFDGGGPWPLRRRARQPSQGAGNP